MHVTGIDKPDHVAATLKKDILTISDISPGRKSVVGEVADQYYGIVRNGLHTGEVQCLNPNAS